MNFVTWLIFSVVALFVTLVLEVLLAMAVYVYLNLYHEELFGSLVGWAGTTLQSLREMLSESAPELATASNVSILGELAPKAFLLLVLGLFASGVIRFFAWMVRRIARTDDY